VREQINLFAVGAKKSLGRVPEHKSLLLCASALRSLLVFPWASCNQDWL